MFLTLHLVLVYLARQDAALLRMCCLECADPVYPPSLYRAVSYVSTLGVPVYILENGMPAKEDDERRTEWIDGCMTEVTLTL